MNVVKPEYEMNNKDKEHRRLSLAKGLIILASVIITAFYLLSALGWFLATYYLARSGQLGNELTKFYESLNIADHIIRTSQVLLVVVASFTLLFFRKIALILFLISIAVSLISTFLVGKWGISFLGDLSGLILLLIVYAYAFFLSRRGYLH